MNVRELPFTDDVCAKQFWMLCFILKASFSTVGFTYNNTRSVIVSKFKETAINEGLNENILSQKY
jgi:hypothetical protein